MSTNDNYKDFLSGTATSSTKPFLGDTSEIALSENSIHSEDRYNLESKSTSHMKYSKYNPSEISKKFTYEILKRYSNIDPLFKFDSCDDINIESMHRKPKSIKNEEKISGGVSVSSLRRKRSTGVQYEVPSNTGVHSYHNSRSNSVCNVKAPSRFTSGETGLNHSGAHNTEDRKLPDRLTQCHPFTYNLYNEELIVRTAERNRRLQKLVKMMTVAREREKQENAWKNYINALRRKHGYHNSSSRIPMPILSNEDSPSQFIEDFYKTNFNCNQSDQCKRLLNDFYEPCTSSQTNYYESLNSKYYESVNPLFISIPPVESFPISANPSLKLKRDMSNQCESLYYSHYKAENGNTVLVGTQYSQSGECFKKASKSTVVYKRKISRVYKSSSIQTHLKLLPVKKQEGEEHLTNTENKDAEDIFKTRNIEYEKQEKRKESFDSIETRLDTLIKSVNTLISEMRTNSLSGHSSLANNNKMTISRSVDAVRFPNSENLNGESFDIKFKQTLGDNVPSLLQNSSKLNHIIVEEMNKSHEAKRYIENILNGNITNSRAVQITDYIPTRDCSTEVTKSLSTTKVCSSEMTQSPSKVNYRSTEVTQRPSDVKICSTEITDSLSKTKVDSSEDVQRKFSEKHRMTMAVNTDPLGLQALLRISKETVKSVLSFMQNFSYQNLLQLPTIRENDTGGTHFVCSICGAIFMTPTLLTEHLQGHVRNRYCCVCRHVASIRTENPRRVFFCEYCSKPFSRAYCCELHQQTCAKRLGRLRDVTSSLVLLK